MSRQVFLPRNGAKVSKHPPKSEQLLCTANYKGNEVQLTCQPYRVSTNQRRVRAAPSFSETAKLLASDGAAADSFGRTVTISKDIIVVGALGDDDNGSSSGSAYVFEKQGNSWVETAKLLASDGASGDSFGGIVAISKKTIVVGAIGDDDNGSNSGSAYVFEKKGNSWFETAKLLASDGAASDFFGFKAAISKDIIVVGALGDDDNGSGSGSAYVFEKQGNSWVETAKLLASDGAPNDSFTTSVAISKKTIVVGAYIDDDNGSNSGSAYVFEKQGNLWFETAKLLASDGAPFDGFGWSVAISKDIIVIGARGDDDNGSQAGSAYVYEKQGNSWVETAKLLASDGAATDFFGWTVAIDKDTIVVGATGDDDNGSISGSTYVYEKQGSSWVETAKLLASDGAAGDQFGWSAAISKDTVVVGTIGDDDNGLSSGSAYVFSK